MGLAEQLSSDLKNAMKAGDETTVGVLRLINSALKNKSIEKRAKAPEETLTEEEVLQIFRTEAKKRKESIEVFVQGGREDLAAKERAELVIIERYLPSQLSEVDIEREIEKMLPSLKGKEFGPAMKEVSQVFKGRADGRLVSEILKKKLTS